jgi:hypothetical protein
MPQRPQSRADRAVAQLRTAGSEKTARSKRANGNYHAGKRFLLQSVGL